MKARWAISWLLVCLAAHGLAAELVVRVVDPTGGRVPEARVAAFDPAGGLLAEATTSRAGEAAFSGEVESVEVHAAGFRAARAAAAGQAELTVRLELEAFVGALEVSGDALEPLAPVASDAVRPDRLPRSDLVGSLRAAPHVHVLRRGGTNFEPVVQGLRETQVAMVVDGSRTFAAGPARMDSELSHVDPGQVASVEVVTGPYALTEGAGAMAAILVQADGIPRYPDWRVGLRGSLGWRSNGAGRFAQTRVDAGRSNLGFSLRGGGDLQADYRAGGSGRQIAARVPGDASGHQVGASLRFNPSERQEVQLGGFYDEQTGVDYPGRLLTAEHFLLRAWRARYRWANADRLVSGLRLNAYVSKKSHRMSNRGKPTAMDMPGRRPPFALDVSLPTEADTVGGAGRVELSPSEAWRVHLGFDAFRLEQDAQRFIARAADRRLLFSDPVWAGVSLRNTGLYVHAGRLFDRGEAQATARFDFVGSGAGRPSAFFREHSGARLDRSETNSNASFAGRYDLGAGFTLAGGVGRVTRTANALERYSDRFPSTRFQIAAEFMGSPGIRPESSLQGDLNLEWKTGTFRFHAGGYARRLSDYITALPDPSLPKRLPLSPPMVFRYANGRGAFFRGWHFGARRATDRLELRVQASQTIADDRELREPVLGIAPLEVASSVRFLSRSRRFWAEYGLRNVWDQRRVSATRFETPSPGFTLHGARLGAELGSAWTLHAGIENLGDKFYYEHLNSLNPFTRQRVPEMGRAVAFGLSARW